MSTPLDLVKEELECGMFGHLYRAAVAQNDGHLTMNQAHFLHDTELARYCPCTETMTEVTTIGSMTEDVTVCGSYQEMGNMNTYRQYCREMVSSVNENELYQNALYDVAHDKYLRKVRELNENETLTYEEILHETRLALEELEEQLVQHSEINYCVEGCAIFIRDSCCLDYNFT